MRITNPRARTVIALVAVLMPARIRRALHRRLLGYAIDPSAVIGRALIDVDEFRAGPRASVAGLNVIRGCERVELGPDASIAPLNWINGIRRSKLPLGGGERDPSFVMRRAAAVTSMHFIDCCDRVDIGSYALVAGVQSQLLTHSFDHHTGRQSTAPITIGDYSVVGTRTLMMPGVELGNRSIVAGGAVLVTGKYDELSLFAGVPAKRKSSLDPEGKLFTRIDPEFH